MSWRNRHKNRERKSGRVAQFFGCGSGAREIAGGELVNMPGVGMVPAGTNGYGKTVTYTPPAYPAHAKHKGDPIDVGNHTIWAGAHRDLTADDLEKFDVLIPLLQDIPYMAFGKAYIVLAAPLVDYGGVPPGWGNFLTKQVVPLLENERKILAFCMGSHGRTGCFLASLVALLETKEETPDPIAAIRKRHCKKAVESLAQATAIFALRGEVLPEKYVDEFTHTYAAGFQYQGKYGGSYGGFQDWELGGSFPDSKIRGGGQNWGGM